jgi:hypothetical protein
MGLLYSKEWDPAQRIPDLSGKVAIVTGAKHVWYLAATERVTDDDTALALATP